MVLLRHLTVVKSTKSVDLAGKLEKISWNLKIFFPIYFSDSRLFVTFSSFTVFILAQWNWYVYNMYLYLQCIKEK